MPILRIVSDENIPFARNLFAEFGEVRVLPAHEITPEALHETDVLLVRSVTRVDAALLGGSRVSFVGSATIGTDHIDTGFLHQRGTAFAWAPGSNAESVVEYVLAALLRLAVRRDVVLEGRTIGIVGCGNIGSRLAERLPAFGLRVIKNDPPLAEEAERQGRAHEFRPLEDIMDEADIVTLHVPLVRSGRHRTEYLFDRSRLEALRSGAWLINSSRGAVIDNAALEDVLASPEPSPGVVVLDVWEHEPLPSRKLLSHVSIATPHIAGYSHDGKTAGAVMLYKALAAHLGMDVPNPALRIKWPPPGIVTPPDPRLPRSDWLDMLTVQMYDISADDRRMRALIGRGDDALAEGFVRLRRDYPSRRTFSAHRLHSRHVPGGFRTSVECGLRVPLDGPPDRRACYGR